MGKQKREVIDPFFDEMGIPTFYKFTVTPEDNGLHRLEFFEHSDDRGAVKIERHSLPDLLLRILDLDIDTLRSRQAETHRARKQIAYLKSFPPRAM